MLVYRYRIEYSPCERDEDLCGIRTEYVPNDSDCSIDSVHTG